MYHWRREGTHRKIFELVELNDKERRDRQDDLNNRLMRPGKAMEPHEILSSPVNETPEPMQEEMETACETCCWKDKSSRGVYRFHVDFTTEDKLRGRRERQITILCCGCVRELQQASIQHITFVHQRRETSNGMSSSAERISIVSSNLRVAF